MKAQTFENLIADQKDRIQRNSATEEENSILIWIEDINREIPKNH